MPDVDAYLKIPIGTLFYVTANHGEVDERVGWKPEPSTNPSIVLLCSRGTAGSLSPSTSNVYVSHPWLCGTWAGTPRCAGRLEAKSAATGGTARSSAEATERAIHRLNSATTRLSMASLGRQTGSTTAYAELSSTYKASIPLGLDVGHTNPMWNRYGPQSGFV